VRIPFVTSNLRAVLTEVTADSPASLKGVGDELEESGGPIGDDPDSKVKLKWKVDNPDKDKLRYRVQYRLLGTKHWFDLLRPKELLTSETYTWDTVDLPEGRYRIRVLASDELSNPPSLAKRHQLESGVVLVDNTPPSIEQLRVNGRVIEGIVLDGVGPVQRIELSVSGSEEWFPFFVADGLPAALQVDDAETAITQANFAAQIGTRIIWPPMRDAIEHVIQFFVLNA
jgi:hypothetical protein